MLQLFNIVIFCCFISTTYAMQSDQSAFAEHMIAKWKNKGLTFFDPFVLQEQDWLRSDTNLEAIGYLSLRHKTYFQNSTLRNFFIKTCKQNPQEAEILRERFTEYQTHLATRLSQLESKKLITAQQMQEINKFVASILGILHEASVWNDGPFMQGIISAFWGKRTRHHEL